MDSGLSIGRSESDKQIIRSSHSVIRSGPKRLKIKFFSAKQTEVNSVFKGFSNPLTIPGVLHLSDCPGQPLLPVWHIVAGSTGLLVPLLYLLFDDLNPALAARCPGLSEALDNVVVFVLPGERQSMNSYHISESRNSYYNCLGNNKQNS